MRKFAPYADPLILPCVALLNGLGLVMIHRLDLAQIDQAAALGRELPTELVVPADRLDRDRRWCCSSPCSWLVRDHRLLARYGYTAGFVGLVLLALPGLLPAVDLRGQRRPALAAARHRSPSSPASSPRSC